MPYVLGTGGIRGEMIRDLVVESIEPRCSDNRLPYPVHWVFDNGSFYRVHEMIDVAIGLALVPCFTTVRCLPARPLAFAR